MSRIVVIEGATITEEAVAPQIGINWDPQTDEGVVVFKLATEYSVNGEFKQLLPHPVGEMTFTIDEILEYVFDVTLPDNSVIQMPGGMLFLGIKAAVDKLYSVRFPPPVEPEPPVEDPPEDPPEEQP